MNEKIRLPTLFSILFGCALNSAHAIPPAPNGCNISMSTPQLDYGDITSDRMHNEGIKQNDGTFRMGDKYVNLTVTCQRPELFSIEIAADTADEHHFDVGHGAKAAFFIEKITTSNGNSKNIKFWPRGLSSFESATSHAWGAGYMLSTTNTASAHTTIEMKVRLILPEEIRKTRTPLDIDTDFTFTLGGNIQQQIRTYEQGENFNMQSSEWKK